MDLYKAMARIASIPFLVVTGCTADLHQTEPSPASSEPPSIAPPAPPLTNFPPSVVPPEPAPFSAQTPLTQDQFSVPGNTRDPVLVERGVGEWLDRQPGYPAHQKTAILHRMRQESSFNPCAVNGPMRYLFQWRGDRLRHLYQATRSRPGTCPTWLSQMQFMDQEIKSNTRYAQFLSAENYPIAYRLFTQAYLGGAMSQLYE